MGLSLGTQFQEKKLGHFNVTSDALLQKKKPLDIELGGADCKLGSSTAREYLRVYYSDFLGVAPAKGPDFTDSSASKVEEEEWVRWMEHAQPRTRVDAYPLLLVCKDLLRRLAGRDIRIISSRNEELAAALARAEARIAAQDRELRSLRSALQARLRERASGLADPSGPARAGIRVCFPSLLFGSVIRVCCQNPLSDSVVRVLIRVSHPSLIVRVCHPSLSSESPRRMPGLSPLTRNPVGCRPPPAGRRPGGR